MNNKTLAQKGFDIITKYESCQLNSYYCPAHKLTIGYGHTGADVKENQTITKEEAQKLFKSDLKRFETTVNCFVKVPLNQNQFDALVSLCYNIGTGAFKMSTLLKLLNAGKYQEAAKQFLLWNKAKGKILNGLVKRRYEEMELFLNGN